MHFFEIVPTTLYEISVQKPNKKFVHFYLTLKNFWVSLLYQWMALHRSTRILKNIVIYFAQCTLIQVQNCKLSYICNKVIHCKMNGFFFIRLYRTNKVYHTLEKAVNRKRVTQQIEELIYICCRNVTLLQHI